MNEQQRFLLISNRKSIGDDLRPDDVFSYLQSKFILDVDEVELIKTEKTSRRRTESLLKTLLDKGSSGFVHFHGALVDAGYEHLADLLVSGITERSAVSGSDDEDESYFSVEAILRDGGVPQRPAVHAKRPKEIEKLKNALRQLRDNDGWVLLHGMAGSGKTVLAAEVLADRELLYECFPGGVFWVSIGIVDGARLLMKMQNLCTRLDSDSTHALPRNVEEARDRIRVLFAHNHPRSLLVLDDLWTKEDARYFDVRARTLVTSRNDFITDNITGTVMKVRIEEGLTDDQSRSVLSQWVHTTSLPAEAEALIKACQGSPLAMSMIGALLKAHSKRWEYYVKQLQDHKVSKLKSKLAYDYPTLYDAIAISVSSLPEDIRKNYEYFAIFEEDSRIPAKVLALLWDQDELEAEDTMDELISRSLAKRHPATADTSHETYSVHDLQLDYLKESRTEARDGLTLSDMHKELVTKYSARFKGDFALIPDDGYVYWNIINHLIEAKMLDKAVDLLLSFTWIEEKLRATGAPDLINSYYRVISLLDEEAKSELRDFVHFIGINSYLLSTPGNKEYGLIQLALAQPFASRAHAKALAIVSSDTEKKKFYVGWCNKPDESSETCLLTVKPHTGPVLCCHWAQDGSERIASCGGDALIKIWNACTGKDLLTLSGHTDTVHCCQFSPDSTQVVSSSADKTIKVWDSVTGRIQLTLKGHGGDVNCCTFNPLVNGRVATCSTDTTIKIWDIVDGNLLQTMTGHEDSVNWCCFSPDGTRVASASIDKSVKVWNVDKGSCLFSCCGDKDFISYCVYNPSGKEIIATSQHFLQFLDAETGKPLKTIQTTCSVLSIAFSPDGKYLVGTSADSTAQLWDVEAEVCMGIFRGHSGWLHSVCFSPHPSKRIVTASADETCKVWKVEPIKDRAVKLRKVFDAKLEGIPKPLIAAANTNHELQLIDGSDGTMLQRSAPLGDKITACRFGVAGDVVFVGLKNGEIKVVKVDNCEVKLSFLAASDAITDCIVSSDDNVLVTCSKDGSVKIWGLDDLKSFKSCQGHTDEVTKCVFYNNNQCFATSSFDGSVKVWDLASGRCKFTCHHNNNDSVLSCAVSTDDQLLISTSAGSTAKLWNANTGELLNTLTGHSDCVRCASFSSDNALVVTGSDDSSIEIWDTKSGQNLATCEGHKVWVTDVQFSSSGDKFVSVSSDIKWWKSDGTLLQTFLVRGNYLRLIKVSKDFKKFITIDDTGQMYILGAI